MKVNNIALLDMIISNGIDEGLARANNMPPTHQTVEVLRGCLHDAIMREIATFYNFDEDEGLFAPTAEA